MRHTKNKINQNLFRIEMHNSEKPTIKSRIQRIFVFEIASQAIIYFEYLQKKERSEQANTVRAP